MAKVTREPLQPGETFFGGGCGVLVPFRPNQVRRSGTRPSTPVPDYSADRIPDPGTRAYAELHGLPYDPEEDPEEIIRLLEAGEPLPLRSRQLLGLEDAEPEDPEPEPGKP